MLDTRDREIACAMTVLVSSLEVGTDVEQLAHHTGFPLEIIQTIADNMTKAGLWIGLNVDDSECWDENGELDGVALFAHAQVALGSVLRRIYPDSVLYIDRETEEEVLRRKRTLH